MTGDKLLKSELCLRISAQTGLTDPEAHAVVAAVLSIITAALRDGHRVGLRDLGTFRVRAVPSRSGYRPGTDQRIEIPAGRTVGFKGSARLKRLLAP